MRRKRRSAVADISLGILILLAIFITSCQRSHTENKSHETPGRQEISDHDSIIHIYSFHFTRRCITCLQLEDTVRSILKTCYNGQVQKGLITFQDINLDKKEGKQLAEKLRVSGQALLIQQGRKITDLTTKGFLYIDTQPQKVHDLVKEAIDHHLEQSLTSR